AGSGKTRVLTRRIAWLIGQRGVHPGSILAITFTNKAAAEMRERVRQLVGDRAEHMWVMTFHAACARFLRSEAERLGYRSSFTIYDQGDQVRLVKQCLEALEKDPKRFAPAAVHHVISNAKNQLLGPVEYRNQVSDFMEETVAEVYELYDTRLRASNAMDFDDMLRYAVLLLEQHDDVRERWQKRFRFIMVDEYQDTNHAQYRMLRALAGEHHNVMCVGDADQSIYSWRGADIRNITSFEEDYPDAKVVVLDLNYRSTSHILEAANAVVRHNEQRLDKDLKAVLGEGEPVRVVGVEDEHAEARFVVDQIEQAMQDGRSHGDVAVFYRTNAQSRVLEDLLTRTGRPYQVIGGPKFYERAEIKDALAYLQVLVNPDDSLSLQRIVNVPKRGIGDTTVAKLRSYADTYGETLSEAVRQAGMEGSINAGTLKKLNDFTALVDSMRQFSEQADTVAETIEHVYETSGITAALQAEDTIESQGRLENLGELVNVAREYDALEPGGRLAEFLQALSLQSQADDIESSGGQITLMTIHNAKGLEYPVVFITGMEEGLFPHSRSIQDGDVEEERRLAYVGITRAREQLTLVYAQSRSVFGRRQYNVPSRFLDELPDEHVERSDQGSSGAFDGRGASAWGRGGGSGSSWGSGLDDGGSAYGASGWKQSRGRQGGQRRAGGGDEFGATFGAKAGSSGSKGWGSSDGTSASGASGMLFGAGADSGAHKRKVPRAAAPPIAVGDRVRHGTFGEGVVLDHDGGDMAVIRFEDGSERRLMLSYAPIEKL
ncbi:MAG: UvrD-helicase domain-containing protein, partial [Thermoleophilia bacterium]|nr:UvrD-helicase domain-containing protein [Thermoleophilia bacterium]